MDAKGNTMTVCDAAIALVNNLRINDKNIQTVGVIEKNTEEYKVNPQLFSKEFKEDSIIVYTINKPTAQELELTEYEGFKVKWEKLGKIIMCNEDNEN